MHKKKLIPWLFLLITLSISNTNNHKSYAATNNITAPQETYYDDIKDVDKYYNNANIDGLKHEQLLSQLATSMNVNHRYYTNYGDIKGANAFSDEDIDITSNIIDFYTGISFKNTWDGGVTWNREHVWCKNRSNGLYTDVSSDSKRGAGADIHQLKPSFQSVNSSRKDKFYSDLNKQGNEVMYEGIATGNYSNNISFEPRDDIKGDIARILMYMYTHYSSEVSTNIDRLSATDTTSSSKSGDLKITDIIYVESGLASDAWDLILKWNELDKVDYFEVKRNEYCASITGVRNPYIDHPEFATMIWDESYDGDGALEDSEYFIDDNTPIQSIDLYHDKLNIKVGEQIQLHVKYTPYYASENYKQETWTSSAKDICSVENGIIAGLKEGSATINVKVGDFEKTCLIIVEEQSQETCAVYTIDTKTSVISSGNIIEGSTATYSQTHKNKGQMTANNSTTLTLTGYQGYCIKGITLNIRSNTSAGAGGIIVKANEKVLANINEGTPFNDKAWAGKYSNTFVDVELTILDEEYIIQENDVITIQITASENSLFINEYRIYYDTYKETIPVQSIVLDNDTITLNVGESTKIIANILPENATDKRLKFISTNTSIVTVNDNGLIVAHKKGTANIQVQSYDAKVVANCLIIVNDPSLDISSDTPIDSSSDIEYIPNSQETIASNNNQNPTTNNSCFNSANKVVTLISIICILGIIIYKKHD